MFAHLRRTWGDTTQNITCDMLTLEWHRTPEYGYASKIVLSQPMLEHNTTKFDIDHAVSALNGVAGRDGAAYSAGSWPSDAFAKSDMTNSTCSTLNPEWQHSIEGKALARIAAS